MALADITRDAVLKAVAECDELGQDRFLGKYHFDPARLYVLVHDGKRYDSKAIAGAAHGYLPGQNPLMPRQFSGGEATVGRLLRRLGFTVQVGDALTPDILVNLLAKLRVYRSGGPPTLYQPITLLWAFGRARRGEPRLAPWPQVQQEVGELLTRYGRGETASVYYPVAALHGAGLWELDAQPESVPSAHGSSVPQRWFDEHQPNGGLVKPVYHLLRDSPGARAAAVATIAGTYFAGADPAALLAELGLTDPAVSSPAESAFAALTEGQRQSLAREYQRLCGRADVHWQGLDDKRAAKTASVPVRYEDARAAVMLRSQGRCENPRCTGDIQDLTDAGGPILEVDHLHDLAKGGADLPAQMIALCPNCHAVKTRGSTRHDLRQALVEQARRRHDELSKSLRTKDAAAVDEVERRFHRAMVAIYETAKRELGYNATRFLQMLSDQGGLATARQLLWSDTPSDGFTTLWEHHRLDLTVEDHVLRAEFATLFSDADREQALARLKAYGWRPRIGTEYEIG